MLCSTSAKIYIVQSAIQWPFTTETPGYGRDLVELQTMHKPKLN